MCNYFEWNEYTLEQDGQSTGVYLCRAWVHDSRMHCGPGSLLRGWLPFSEQCAFMSPGHQEAAGPWARRESQPVREKKKKRGRGGVWRRDRLWLIKTKDFPHGTVPRPQLQTRHKSPRWFPSHLATGLTVVASTHRENIRAAVRGKMITRDQGICCWQAGAECVFRWWQAPGGLTDRPADFMLKHYLSGATQACKLLTAVHIQ